MANLTRFSARHGALLVIDLQEKLTPLIADSPAVIAQTVRLVKAARILEIPNWATEQYPKGLGSSVPEIATLFPSRPDKTTFHCCVPEVVEQIHGRKIQHVTLAGIETHVCVAQTALELLRLGLQVQIPADAVASRGPIDKEFALRRLERAGAVVTTSEAVLFEWIESSDHPAFKRISELVKSFSPTPR